MCSNQLAIVASSIRCLTHKPSAADLFGAESKGTCTIFIFIWWWPLGLNNFLLLCSSEEWESREKWEKVGDPPLGCLWLASEALGVKTTWNCIGHCLNCCGSRTLNFRLLFILRFISDAGYSLLFVSFLLFAFFCLVWSPSLGFLWLGWASVGNWIKHNIRWRFRYPFSQGRGQGSAESRKQRTANFARWNTKEREKNLM